jgi:hypothetical protein
VQVPSFDTNPQYPFIDAIADLVTMQSAPLTCSNVSEIGRLLRLGGKAELWVDLERFQAAVDKLALLLGCTPTYSTKPGSGCPDQFSGTLGLPKVCLQKNK